MDFGNRVETTTQDKIMAKAINIVLDFSPVLLRLLGNQKKWTGERYKVPVIHSTNDQGRAFDGMDKFSTSLVDTRVNAYFDATGHEIPVVVSQMEVDVNQTEKVIDLVKTTTLESAGTLADNIADDLWAYKTAGTKNFDGFYDAADDGNTTAEYGGLTRSTYTDWVGTVNSSTGALTAAKMRTTMNGCIHGMQKPSLIATTRAVWSYYEALAVAKLSANYNTSGYPQLTRSGIVPSTQALKGDLGFDAIWFSGTPVVVDEKIDTGYMAFINEENFSFYGLKSTKEGYKQVSFSGPEVESVYDAPATTGFSYSGLMEPIDQYGSVGHIILLGNFICKNPRTQGIRTGITS